MSDVRILIIDDNRDFAYLLELSLAAVDGCRVVGTVSDGPGALEAIERLAPDVVLLDIVLPEMDGFEILKAIGKMARGPVVFVMSAIRSREIYDEAIALGAAHYFIKPVDTGALARILREAFGNCQPTAEKATKLLCTLKIPPDIKGFKYLRNIIIDLTDKDASDYGSLVEHEAHRDGVSAQSVQRAIHYAIGLAWDRDEGDTDSFLYPWKRDKEGPPGGARFAQTAARRISMNG